MKRNWLVLTAGIFYIIASISLLYISCYCGYALLVGENIFYDYSLSATDHSIFVWAYISLLVVTIAKFVMFVTFFVLGIIMIKKSKTFDMKPSKIVTITMILGYVGAVIDLNLQIFESSTFILLLTSSIMLSVATSRRGKGENVEATKSVLDDIENAQNNNSEVIESESNQVNNLANQIKSLQALKECGVLSDEEYMKMLKNLVDKTDKNESEEKEKRVFRIRKIEDKTKDEKEQ